MRTRWYTGMTILWLLVMGSTVTDAVSQVDEFHAFILPETNYVESDSVFIETFAVDSTAHQFNAFEITIQFDPEILAFLDVEAGALMNEGCSNLFEHESITDTTVTYTCVLLCQDSTLHGPGDLAYFTFQALQDGESPVDIISDPDRSFFDDGLYVWPLHPTYPRQVIFHNGVVIVGEIVGVADPGPGNLPVRITPNPLRVLGTVEFAVREPSHVVVGIVSIAGRRVWTWRGHGAGRMRIEWPGTDLNGNSLPAGTYFYRVQTGSESGRGKITLVR